MVYQLVIMEDLQEHADQLASLLDGYPHPSCFEIYRMSTSAELEDFLSAGNRVDILLCDIQLGEGQDTGIQLVQRLFPPHSGTQVIYVTGYVEYCTRVYETAHIYFLTKPVNRTDLHAALDRAVSILTERASRCITVQAGRRVLRLPPASIRYIESDRRKVRIYTDTETVETYASLSSLLTLLQTDFVHCHKSFLVNMARIAQLENDCFLLTTGERIPISNKRHKQTRETFLRYLSTTL